MPAHEVVLHFRTLHPKQRLFVESPLKRRILCCGRRSGKTVACAYLAAKFFISGKRVIYIAPTSDQTEQFWFEVSHIFSEAVSMGVVKKNETEKYLSKAGTQVGIRARTGWNSDVVRGTFCDLLICDEYQLADETLFTEVGLPLLLDTGGSVCLVFTPASLRSRSTSKARDRQHAAKLFDKVKGNPNWLSLHWTSHDNPFLKKGAIEEISRDMSALSFKQEVLAERVTEIPGALWNRELIERTRVSEIKTVIKRIVIGCDPSGSSQTEAGILACGVGEDNHVYVIADHSVKAASPLVWAAKAVAAFHSLSADRIVGERNFGGDMVESTIRSVDENVSYKDCISSRGKVVRAEPVCALFEQGRAHIVGELPELEDELCSYVAGDTRSPNRLDAMCFAANELTGEKFGLLGWYKSQVAEVERPALPGANGQGDEHWTKKRGASPTPAPISVEERMALSRNEFDRVIRRR